MIFIDIFNRRISEIFLLGQQFVFKIRQLDLTQKYKYLCVNIISPKIN